MATITRLGFTIDSKYNPAGVTAAREDVRKFSEDLRRLSSRHIRVHVDAEVDPVFPDDFQARVRAISIARNYRLPLEIELGTAEARRQLDQFAARRRNMRVDVDANTAAARANIAHTARNRHMQIFVSTDMGVMHLLRLAMVAKYAAIAVALIAGSFYVVGAAASMVGALMLTALPVAMGVLAAVILKKNDDVAGSFSRLKETATDVFTSGANSMKSAIVQATDSISAALVKTKPLLVETFGNAGKLLQPFTDGLINLVTKALPGMNQAMRESMPVMIGFRDGMGTLGTSIGTMFTNMSKGANGLGETWRVFSAGVGRFFEIIGDAAGRMSSTGAESLRTMMDGINSLLSGIVDGAAPAMESMAGKTSILHAVFEGLGNFFRIAGPAIGQFTEALSGILEPVIRELTPSFARLISEFLINLLPIMIEMTPIIIAVANGFAQLLDMLAPVMPILAPLVAGIWALNIALGANPITLVVIAVAALAGGIVYLATKTQFFQNVWDKIGPTVMAVWEKVQEFGAKLGSLFGPSVMRIVDAVKGAFGMVKEQWESSIKPALDGFVAQLQPLWESLKPILAAIGGAILAIVNVILGIVEHLIKPVVGFILELVGVLINAITSILKVATGLAGTITGVIGIIIQVFKTAFSLIGAIFSGDFSGFLDNLGELGGKIVDLIMGPLKTLGQGILGILDAAWDAIFAVFRGAFGVLHGIVRGIVQGVIGFFQWLFDVLVGHSIVPDLINAIVDLFMWLPRKVIAFVQQLVDGVVALWSFLWETVKSVASGIWNWLTTRWNEFTGAIQAVLRAYSAVAHALWEKLWSTIRDVASGIWDWITDKWNAFTGGVRASLEFWADFLRSIWDRLWNGIKDTATGIWNTITSAFGGFTDGVKNVLEGLVTKAGEIWDKIKGIFATPINFVIGIWNDHIADKIGLGDKKIPKIPGYADGGYYAGRGGPREDANLARLSNGEYIVNARATSQHRPLLDAINYGQVPAFADGGPVEWMTGWIKKLDPSLQVTSAQRDSNDYHGQGKAIDFASSVSAMGNAAGSIAEQWGAKTLELIHGNGFSRNIKDGNNVGTGMGFYGPGLMAEHNNHVHWAVDHPLDESEQGKGFFDRIGGAVSGVISGARELVSGLFTRLTNPLLGAIPDPFVGNMGAPFGSFPKSTATSVRDHIADFIKGREDKGGISGSGGDVGGMIPDGERLAIIDQALQLTNTPPPGSLDEWRKGMNTLITRESGWNAGARNDWDSNAAIGQNSQGLAQVIPSTFNAHKVPGHDNILDPVSNVAASVNYIKDRYGNISNVQQANANMPPKGYADGTDYAQPGWNLVGEEGPEMVKFRGGEEIHSFDEIIARLKSVNVEQRSSDAIQAAVKSNFDQLISDFTGGSIGEGAIPQLFKQAIEYGGKLNSGGDTHFHVGNNDEAVRLEKQRQREKAMGFD